ncbi:MAG TPA: cupin [Actinomycetales bacterium]|nr:cupin [Actinomycetales bacterium]
MDHLALLSGDPAAFLTEVWGRRTHFHDADPATLASIFGIDAADDLITTRSLRTPQVRLAQDGTVLDPSRYTRHATIAGQAMTGLLDTRKVLALFEDGATIVFQGLQRYHEPLRLLVRDLERQIGHPCQANAYLTPPGSQGFALHSDTHDVFTFQTYGTKEWEVHDAEGEHQVPMRPGTCMYLPTGTPHMARTGADTASLHVTVGINQVVWSEVLRDVVTRTIAADATLGEHLPGGLFTDPDALASALRERLAHVAGLLADVDAVAEVDRLETIFGTRRQPVLAGGLRDVLDVRHLAPDTRLRRRPGSQATVRARGDQVEVLLGDRRLTLPARVEPAVRSVLDADTLTPADVRGLDEAGALTLCRRLVREGLLEVVR